MKQGILKNHKLVIKGLFAAIAVAIASILGIGAQNASAIDCDSNDSTRWACYDCRAAHCGATWFNSSEWGGDLGTTIKVRGGSRDATGYIHGAIYTRDPKQKYSSTASHVYILDGNNPGTWGDTWGEFGGNLAGYVYLGQGNDLYRGEEGGVGEWSYGWEWGSVPFAFNIKGFTNGAWRIGNTFIRNEPIYRCYDGDTGCDAQYSNINVEIERSIPDCNPCDARCPCSNNYRVNYQGKISLKNDNNSQLYEHGSMFSSTNWPEYAGWGDENSNVNANLYTPKESGQKLRSKYEIRWQCNNWDGPCGWMVHNTSYYHTDYCVYGLCDNWYTHFRYRSEIANGEVGEWYTWVNGRGGQNEITSQKTKTINSIPYGTAQSYIENLDYTNIGMNHKNAREVLYSYIDDEGEEHVVNYAVITNVDEPHNGLNASRTLNATVHNPYNFNTALSSGINGGNGGTVLGGSTVTLNLSANIKSKTQQETAASSEVGFPYYTKVPDDSYNNVPTVVTAASFILKQDLNTDFNNLSTLLQDRTDVSKYAVPGNDLCNYLRNTFGSNMLADGRNDCRTLFTEDHNSINRNIGDTGWNTSTNNVVAQNGVSAITDEHKNISVSIPDIEDGYKYCTVVGINHADSGGWDGGYRYASNYNDSFRFPFYNINDNWHLSNITCRTIAKVPTFQVWGNVYTSGGIETNTVQKIPDANINTDPNTQKYLFGSWSETFAAANNDIKNFGTGASLGYLNNGYGGLLVTDFSKKTDFCNLSNMTIANTRCNKGANGGKGVYGKAGNISVTNEDFLNKFVAHYATTTTDSLDQVSDTVKYYKTTGNTNINSTKALDEYRRSNSGILSLDSGTLIYQVDGNLTISDNICTGYPTDRDQCRNGSPADVYWAYNLDNENVRYDATFDKIPQVIIIASGDVTINSNVNEIDAWIYSGGTIRTCDRAPGQKEDGNYYCHTPLVINGPVFAKNIELRRTYGSHGRHEIDFSIPYPHSWNGPFTNKSSLFRAGASTPAEVFNLRADVYQWIYQQTSTDDKHANVRYMRELSPRY